MTPPHDGPLTYEESEYPPASVTLAGAALSTRRGGVGPRAIVVGGGGEWTPGALEPTQTVFSPTARPASRRSVTVCSGSGWFSQNWPTTSS